MRAQVRYPSLPVERRMIHIGFRDTLPTACMTDMRAVEDEIMSVLKAPFILAFLSWEDLQPC